MSAELSAKETTISYTDSSRYLCPQHLDCYRPRHLWQKNQAPGWTQWSGCEQQPFLWQVWLATAHCSLHVSPPGFVVLSEKWTQKQLVTSQLAYEYSYSNHSVHVFLSRNSAMCPCVTPLFPQLPGLHFEVPLLAGGLLACPLMVQSYGHLHMPSITLLTASTWVQAWELCAEYRR